MPSKILKILARLRKVHRPTMLKRESNRGAFRVLISTILSARAKDEATIPIVQKLFKQYRTPKEMANASLKDLRRIVYGSGYYRQKAKYIKGTARAIAEKYHGRVPEDLDELISLPGVGRKVANCVLVYAFRKPAIPVDTHVHRVANRLGIVKTKTPEKTEKALMEIIPKRYWMEVNELFVSHGQTTCLPISPFCSRCVIRKYCKRIGVKRSR